MLARIKAAVAQATGKEPVVAAFPGYTDTAVIAWNYRKLQLSFLWTRHPGHGPQSR